MLKKPAFAVVFVTAYLVLYYVLFYAGASEDIITTMFAASPVLVVWMAITIIKHGKYSGDKLDKNEWGYQDWFNDTK
jgi:hypothetical protein